MTSSGLTGGLTSHLEVKNIIKRFGPTTVNNQISLSFLPATIHGIVGENGAGKSTLVNILFGMIQPDSGVIRFKGIERHWKNPSDAALAGIAMVHQHFMLAESETAIDHLLLTQSQWFGLKLFSAIDRKKEATRFLKLAQELGLEFDLFKKIVELEMGDRQRLEILKALVLNPEVLILDEPTAVLTPQESEKLFESLKKLKAQGKTIILISHKLKEIMGHTDRVSVIRKGNLTLDKDTSDVSEKSLAHAMIGDDLAVWNDQRISPKPTGDGLKPQVLLELQGTATNLKEISLNVCPYEIVGVAGIEGNGQVELFDFAMERARLDPTCRLGIIPPDRIHDGLLLSLPITYSFALGQEADPPFSKKILGLKWMNWKKIKTILANSIKEFSIAMSQKDVEKICARELSGGNQQKLLMARALFQNPDLLLVAHPTRGVDIGAARMIHEELLKKRNQGKGILLFSSDLDELFQLADRLVVMFDGKIVARFNHPPFDEMKVGAAMGGAA